MPTGMLRRHFFKPDFFFCHTLKPSPSAGRVHGLKGPTHLSPVHALHFGLAKWVSTPAPRQLSTNTQLTALFTHALTFSTVGIKHYEAKTQHIRDPTLDFSTLTGTAGPLHHQDAVYVGAQLLLVAQL